MLFKNDALFLVDVILSGGFAISLRLKPDDELLSRLMSIITSSRHSAEQSVFNIKEGMGTSSVTFRSEDIIAIRATPPLELAQDESSDDEATTHELETVQEEPVNWIEISPLLDSDTARVLLGALSLERENWQWTEGPSHSFYISDAANSPALRGLRLEFQRAISDRLDGLLLRLGCDLFAYEVSLEVCRLSDGHFLGPTSTHQNMRGRRRVVDFFYLPQNYSDFAQGGTIRLFNHKATTIHESSLNGPGSLAVEFEPMADLAVFFVTGTIFQITPVRMNARCEDTVIVIKGSLTAPL